MTVEPASQRTLDVRPIQAEDVDALVALFSRLDSTRFHPHAMDRAGARIVGAYAGRDVYLAGWIGQSMVAYGMLRGWDEGYEIPSLGIAVSEDVQGRGYGRAMMEALHREAQSRGATSIRLRVHPDNLRARRLYDTLGYRPVGVSRGETLMVVALPVAP